MNNNTICAVIVTFNRKQSLLECLECVFRQTHPVEGLCIIDNASNDDTPKTLLDAGYIQKLPPEDISAPWEASFVASNTTTHQNTPVHYVRMHTNTGGAGGFHEGIKRAFQKGYDWIWVMDDDGKSAPNCLAELLNVGKRGFDYIAPNLIGEDGKSHFEAKLQQSKSDILSFYGGPFNAILLNRRLVKSVGYPMSNFFIWGDEMEYVDRISEAGIPMVTLRNAKHLHKRTNINYSVCKRGFFLARNSVYRYRLFRGVFSSKKMFLLDTLYKCWVFGVGFLKKGNMRQVIATGHGFARGWRDPLRKAQENSCWWGVED